MRGGKRSNTMDADAQKEADALDAFLGGGGDGGDVHRCHVAGAELLMRTLPDDGPPHVLLMNMCADEEGRRLFLCGGMGRSTSLHIYNIESGEWISQHVTGLNVMVNASCFHYYGGRLMLFGGFEQSSACTLIVDLDKMTTMELDVPGPETRYAMASTMVGSDVWMWGGQQNKLLDDLWRFSFETLSWTCISASNDTDASLPSARFYHSLVTHPTVNSIELISFGGSDGKTNFNEVLSCSPDTLQWSELSPREGTELPTKRHALCAVESPCHRFLVCYSGFDIKGVTDPTLWLWEYETRQWHAVRGPHMVKRKWYTAVCVGATVYFYGGDVVPGIHQEPGNGQLKVPFWSITFLCTLLAGIGAACARWRSPYLGSAQNHKTMPHAAQSCTTCTNTTTRMPGVYAHSACVTTSNEMDAGAAQRKIEGSAP
eukprot:TRINITY_DN2176_c0_g1_i20.p1 TRINITY_DN2176_c0_g1~~TRINITY_DN2176_c0_g1_i20.p1  ORF type:complete len:429 (+),score=37.36 TRINITY_DN2176_c0_g1_i20:192-1478(+)